MILITGLPGAGKSVQSELIRDRMGFHWLSTGQMLRNSNDPQIIADLKTGLLLDNDLIFHMVGDRLRQSGYDTTFLLDGFPRTVDQAKWLIEHGREINKHIKLVLYLVVDEAIALERLSGRGRLDDNQATIKKRREEAKKIKPTLDYLEKQGVPIKSIDANGDEEATFAQIKTAIAEVS